MGHTAMASSLRNTRLARLRCWWFGCSPDYEAMRPDCDCVPCAHCGAADTTYEDRIGDTRHSRAVEWLCYWLWRRWWPEKCHRCGCKFDNHCADCQGLPF